MLTFFYKIRRRLLAESKMRKYLFYALGEIVLVVFGILIALQINNWNLRKNQQQEIREYAHLLVQDLEEDIAMVELNRSAIVEISRKIDSLGYSVQNKEIADISNIDFICLTWNVLYRPYKWNRTTIHQLENSGSLQHIENISLTKKIGNYTAFTHHMDGDYLNDKAKSDFALQLISKVVNSNYKNIRALRENVFLRINNPEISGFYFYKQPEYHEARTQNLKLIATDIKEVNEVINSFTRLQTYYQVRSEIELPQLTKDAEELIGLLKEEFY